MIYVHVAHIMRYLNSRCAMSSSLSLALPITPAHPHTNANASRATLASFSADASSEDAAPLTYTLPGSGLAMSLSPVRSGCCVASLCTASWVASNKQRRLAERQLGEQSSEGYAFLACRLHTWVKYSMRRFSLSDLCSRFESSLSISSAASSSMTSSCRCRIAARPSLLADLTRQISSRAARLSGCRYEEAAGVG